MKPLLKTTFLKAEVCVWRNYHKDSYNKLFTLKSYSQTWIKACIFIIIFIIISSNVNVYNTLLEWGKYNVQ
jgi:hypothetical protein